MRIVPCLLLSLLPCGVAAQDVRVDSHGVRSGGTVVDATGVHTAGTSVTRTGVHRGSGGRGGGMTILTNNGDRAVDCGGRSLTINGNGNRLRVANCAAVTVAGNHNDLRVGFGTAGRLTLVGNRNTLSWHAPRGAAVRVSNVGNGNAVSRGS